MILRLLHALYRFLVILFTCIVAVPVTMAGVVLGAFIFLPLPAALPAPHTGVASQVTHVYDIKGNEIAIFREFDQNIPVAQSDIPTILKQAVVSIEDRNFYKHGGVDPRGTARAIIADYRSGKAVQGGSTITQQYVKNAYTDKSRNVIRKVREAILASQLDRQTPKDDILYHYLNSIYLGDGAYGVGAAAQTYFHKSVNKLDVSEAATLAGLIPAPSRWAPRENPTEAETRRQLVLDKMLQQGYLNQADYAKSKSRHIWLLSKGPSPANTPVTWVYPPVQDKPLYPDFVDYLQRYLIVKYGPELVYHGGLKVFTTLDPNIQQQAVNSVRFSLAGTNEPLQMAMASIDPVHGYVEALVGGREFGQGPFANDNFALGGCFQPRPAKYKIEVAASCWSGNTVTGGGTGRQPGSAFKPFVLATALTKGFTPDRVYQAPNPYIIPGCKVVSKASECQIFNAEPGLGAMDIRHATWNSVNTVYAQIVRDVGCKDTGETAKKMGITSAWYSPQFHTCSGTYALGVLDVSPLDMASAYGVLANHGQRAEPIPVLKVLDAKGRAIEDNTHPVTTKVLDPAVADTVTDILRGVIQYGTGVSANIGRPAAGKTGTTSDFTNAWFAGYTPTLSTAVWMGYANNQSTPLNNIRYNGKQLVSHVFGGTIPALTWHNFMAAALKDVPPTDFSQPAPIKSIVDQAKLLQRGGFDAGAQRPPQDSGAGGPYEYVPPPPVADLPTTSTSTSTSTTIPAPATTTTTVTIVPPPKK